MKVYSNLMNNNSKINASEIAYKDENNNPKTLDNLLPVILYDDSTGALSVTLSDSAANYSYIEIFYRTNDNFYNSVKVYQPNGKQVFLSNAWVNNTTNSTAMKLKIITISGNSIQPVNSNRYGQFGVGSGTAQDQIDYVYITRVIGYK